MQLLTFTIGGQPYAIESRRIVEVVPLVSARPLPHVPEYVRGLFMYRGRLVPLVDLGLRLGTDRAPDVLSTRVIVVSLGQDAEMGLPIRTHSRILGLVAEHVISIRSVDAAAIALPPLHLAAAPYLGAIYAFAGETIQTLDTDRLLPDDLTNGLWPAPIQQGLR